MFDPFSHFLKNMYRDAKLLRAWPLTGGVSAQVTAVEVAMPDGTARKLVIRQHGEADLRRNPHIAADEYRLLQALYAAKIPVPEPLYLDTSCAIFPAPVIVTAFVEGETLFSPDNPQPSAAQMASILAGVHSIDISHSDLPHLPRIQDFYDAKLANPPEKPDETMGETHIRTALNQYWPPAQNPPTLLHGDFWPGNVLWKDGEIAAVLDWEDAVFGDSLADVANARLEILWAFGVEAMQTFTGEYLSLTGLNVDALPVWDLCAALRPLSKIDTWGLEAAQEAKMRVLHAEFVQQAIFKLGY